MIVIKYLAASLQLTESESKALTNKYTDSRLLKRDIWLFAMLVETNASYQVKCIFKTFLVTASLYHSPPLDTNDHQ